MTPRKPPDVGPESQLLHGAELQAQIEASQAMLQARQNKPSPAGRLDLASRLVATAGTAERLALLEALDSVSDEDKAVNELAAAARELIKAYDCEAYEDEEPPIARLRRTLTAWLQLSSGNTPDTSCGDSPEVLTQIKTE